MFTADDKDTMLSSLQARLTNRNVLHLWNTNCPLGMIYNAYIALLQLTAIVS